MVAKKEEFLTGFGKGFLSSTNKPKEKPKEKIPELKAKPEANRTHKNHFRDEIPIARSAGKHEAK